MIDINSIMYGKEYPITNINTKDDKIELEVNSIYTRKKCPNCGQESRCVHDFHIRRVQDTPIHNKETWLKLTVKEFECTNEVCETKTFTEEIPFVGKNQVMTYYLQYYIVTLAIYMSSSATALILSLLGVKTSADTVDNLLKKIEINDNPNVEKIGIDDVALRKGINYATAIYDLETHQLIALLKGREKDDIVPWLKEHPKIKYVARDRASAYAEAISEVFPDAIQVADRFHLFENITKYLKDMLYQELPDKIVIKNGEVLDKKAEKVVKELANIDESILNSLNYDNTEPVDKNNNKIEFISTRNNLNSKESIKQSENRIKKYEAIKNMNIDYKENYLTIYELKEKYGYSITAIKKYLNMTNEEIEKIKEKRTYNTKENKMSPYCNIIYKMLVDGISLEYIFAYIKKIGYDGSDMSLRTYIGIMASNNDIGNINFNIFNRYEYYKDETIITRYELFKYLLTLDENKIKNEVIEKNIDIIKTKFNIVEKIRDIFINFHDTIFSNDITKLDEFINKYSEDMKSFCNGLKKDINAIQNAISYEINSGFVEGNNNKFKLIKRIVYGKQKLCNLFKRCWLNFSSTLDNLDDLKIAMTPFLK